MVMWKEGLNLCVRYITNILQSNHQPNTCRWGGHMAMSRRILLDSNMDCITAQVEAANALPESSKTGGLRLLLHSAIR